MNLALLRARKRILSDVPNEPAVGLSLSSSALTVEQNGSVTITVFATRSGGFTGTLTPSVAGLPSGLTPFFFPATLGAADSSCQLTLTASENATAVTNDAFTVSIASSLGTQTANATVTITNAATSGEIPIVSSVTPSSGAPDQTRAVTISGLNFITGATVDVGNGSTWTAATSVVRVNDTTITATLPALALGTYSVRVTTSGGVGVLPNAVSYGVVVLSFDNFDNGQTNNQNGFVYTDLVRSEVVNTEQFSGTHSVQMRYTIPEIGRSSRPEIRFDFGQNVTEVWIEFRQKMAPTWYADDCRQMKQVRLWGSNYNTDLSKVGCGTWGNVIAGQHLMRYAYVWEGYNTAIVGNGPAGAPNAQSPMVRWCAPADLDRWVRYRYHFKMVSALNARDGVFRYWIDDTLSINYTNIPGRYDPAVPYWRVGYLMGSADPLDSTRRPFGLTEVRTWVDDLTFYTSNPGWL